MLFIIGGLVFAGLTIVLFTPFPGPLIGGLLMLVGLVIGYFVMGTNHTIELDGDKIREKRLFILGQVEHSVSRITPIVPLYSGVPGSTGVVRDAILGTINRGFLLRFESGRMRALIRGDLVGMDGFRLVLKGRPGPCWTEIGSRN